MFILEAILHFHFFSLLPYWFRILAAPKCMSLKIFHPTQLTWLCRFRNISSSPAARWFSLSRDWSSHILRSLGHCLYYPSPTPLLGPNFNKRFIYSLKDSRGEKNSRKHYGILHQTRFLRSPGHVFIK